MLKNYDYINISRNFIIDDGYDLRDLPHKLFNTSMIKIDENNYLCLIRYSFHFNKEIIPGNSERCIPNLSSRGDNFFWWNNWGHPLVRILGGTLFAKYNPRI